jgi:hypothetical protein
MKQTMMRYGYGKRYLVFLLQSGNTEAKQYDEELA